MKMKQPAILKKAGRNQRGFTLIELLIAIALTGIIGAAAGMSIHQVIIGTALSNDLNTAVNQVRNAGHWISRDVQMAKPNLIVVNNDPAEQNFLELTIWEDASGSTTHAVIYTLQDGELWRDYDGGTTDTLIAQYVASKQGGVTWCDWDPDSGLLSVTISAQVGQKTETRAFEVKPRPD